MLLEYLPLYVHPIKQDSIWGLLLILYELIQHKVLPGYEIKLVAILNVFTHRVHSEAWYTHYKNGFQHIVVLRLWSTVDTLTDTESVVRSTIVGIPSSLCSFLLLAKFFTRNDDCRNKICAL